MAVAIAAAAVVAALLAHLDRVVVRRIGDGALAFVLLLVVLARVGLLHAVDGRARLEHIAHHLVGERHALLRAAHVFGEAIAAAAAAATLAAAGAASFAEATGHSVE